MTPEELARQKIDRMFSLMLDGQWLIATTSHPKTPLLLLKKDLQTQIEVDYLLFINNGKAVGVL